MIREKQLRQLSSVHPSVRNIDRIIFDHRVGQQLFTHICDLFAGAVLITGIQFQFNVLALADFADAVKPEAVKRMLTNLGIMDKFLSPQGEFQAEPGDDAEAA